LNPSVATVTAKSAYEGTGARARIGSVNVGCFLSEKLERDTLIGPGAGSSDAWGVPPDDRHGQRFVVE
jgi:hypothetical protein